jgi:hypothetical protein
MSSLWAALVGACVALIVVGALAWAVRRRDAPAPPDEPQGLEEETDPRTPPLRLPDHTRGGDHDETPPPPDADSDLGDHVIWLEERARAKRK